MVMSEILSATHEKSVGQITWINQSEKMCVPMKNQKLLEVGAYFLGAVIITINSVFMGFRLFLLSLFGQHQLLFQDQQLHEGVGAAFWARGRHWQVQEVLQLLHLREDLGGSQAPHQRAGWHRHRRQPSLRSLRRARPGRRLQEDPCPGPHLGLWAGSLPWLVDFLGE